MTSPNHMIFDTARVRAHLARAAAHPETFLYREMLERLTDRLSDMKRIFPRVLDVGGFDGLLKEYLPASAGVTSIEQIDGLLDDAPLTCAENSFDLVIACGSLHWVNDLPGALIQMQRVLKPDGLLLAMLPGGETLKELRMSFEAAELKMKGGISPRVSPFVDIRDAGALLQRAGFALPVVDSEVIDVEYAHPLKLLHDLKRMGQSNAICESVKGFTTPALMMLMADHYMHHFAGEEGRVKATFEFVTLTAWKPHHSQQQPAKRGSGKVSLSLIGDQPLD